MQRGDAWRAVAELLPERYPSALLDHREHTLRGPPRRDRRGRRRPRSLVGYSMGGRLALHAALREPARYARPRHGRGDARASRTTPARARARRTRSSPRWMERASRSRTSSSAGSASRSSPTQSRDADRGASGPAACRIDPRDLALAAAHRGPGRARARLGRPAASWTLPLLAIAGERDERYAAAAPRAWPTLVPRGRVERDRGRRPRPPARAPRGVAAALLRRVPRPALGLSRPVQVASVGDLDAQARALRDRQQAVAGRAQRAGERGVEQLQRRQAAGQRDPPRRPPAGARRRFPRGRPACSRGRRRARARAASRIASRAAREAAARRELDVHDVAGAALGGAARTSSAPGDRLVGGDRDLDTRARTSASSSSVAHGCSTSWRS